MDRYLRKLIPDLSHSKVAAVLSSTSSFLMGLLVGVTLTTIYPNLLPNLEYYRRNYFVQFYYTFLHKAVENSTDQEGDHHANKPDIYQFSSKLQLMVLPNWIDRNKHMNNARYIYELNFARRQFFYELRIIPLLDTLKCNLVLQSQTIRYRKELSLWQKFYIEVKLIDWNDSNYSFFLESKFIDSNTGFIHAVHYAKYRIISSAKVAKGEKKPTLPTPTELLVKLQLVDPEMVSLERDHSIASSFSSAAPSTASVLEAEDLPIVAEQKANLSQENKFVIFWESANAISSKDLNPSK